MLRMLDLYCSYPEYIDKRLLSMSMISIEADGGVVEKETFLIYFYSLFPGHLRCLSNREEINIYRLEHTGKHTGKEEAIL